MTAIELEQLADNDDLMEIGRQAIEDELVEWRDGTMFTLRNNGLVIRNKDGSHSHIIRFGPEVGVRIALKAIAQHLKTP